MVTQKQEIQNLKTNYIRSIFVETAIEIIQEEGPENISTRKIANKSGYSLGTLYYYFKNIDELLWTVRSRMIEDINKRTKAVVKRTDSVEELSQICIYAVKYMIKNKYIYEFFYTYYLDPKAKPKDHTMNNIEIVNWIDFLYENKGIKKEDVILILEILNFSLCGMLSVYFSNNYHLEEEFIYEEIPKIINKLINNK